MTRSGGSCRFLLMQKQTERKLRGASDRLAAMKARRDEVIREAHADGVTLRAIAAVVGLSHARVYHIVKGGGQNGEVATGTEGQA